jgi:hypothetical protein
VPDTPSNSNGQLDKSHILKVVTCKLDCNFDRFVKTLEKSNEKRVNHTHLHDRGSCFEADLRERLKTRDGREGGSV